MVALFFVFFKRALSNCWIPTGGKWGFGFICLFHDRQQAAFDAKLMSLDMCHLQNG